MIGMKPLKETSKPILGFAASVVMANSIIPRRHMCFGFQCQIWQQQNKSLSFISLLLIFQVEQLVLLVKLKTSQIVSDCHC